MLSILARPLPELGQTTPFGRLGGRGSRSKRIKAKPKPEPASPENPKAEPPTSSVQVPLAAVLVEVPVAAVVVRGGKPKHGQPEPLLSHPGATGPKA